MKKRKPRTKGWGDVKIDKIQTIACVCLICGELTGATEDWRKSTMDATKVFQSPDPKRWKLRKGICSACQKQKDEGCVLMYSNTRGVILNPSAREKLQKEFRDLVIKIPESEMDVLLGSADKR